MRNMMAKDRYLNRSKTRCISGEKNKSIGQRFRDYQFRSPSIPLTTPINQLTALKKKRKKRKKGRRNWSLPVKNLIRGSDRRSITVSRAGERPGIRVNHVGSIERSNDLRTVCRREKSSAYRDGLHSPHASEAR